MRTETFPTPGQVRLQVQIPGGDVDVQTGDVQETTVQLEVSGRDGEQLEQETRIESRPRGDGFEVVVEAPRGRGLGLFRRNGNYHLDVTVPHGAELSAELASADLRARGRYAETDVSVASGDVELERVEGEAKVDTASGDVEIASVQSAKLNSASGDVEIDEAAGDVQVNTASGDIELRRVIEGDVKLNSASGDIEVGIAKGSRLWVDAQSLSGDTSSELELESGAPVETDEGPLIELRAVTMSGDISVRRA
jgi:Putative adhesin